MRTIWATRLSSQGPRRPGILRLSIVVAAVVASAEVAGKDVHVRFGQRSVFVTPSTHWRSSARFGRQLSGSASGHRAAKQIAGCEEREESHSEPGCHDGHSPAPCKPRRESRNQGAADDCEDGGCHSQRRRGMRVHESSTDFTRQGSGQPKISESSCDHADSDCGDTTTRPCQEVWHGTIHHVKHLATDLSRHDISRRQPGPSDTSLDPFQAIASRLPGSTRMQLARRTVSLAGGGEQVEARRLRLAG